MSTSPFVIENLNLSNTWVAAVSKINQSKGREITPLIVTITDFSEVENIRKAVDRSLNIQRLPAIETVASTIFPESLYEYAGYDRNEFYKTYLRLLPRFKKIDSSNGNGIYFERLISFDTNGKKVNQLEIIISSLIDNNVKRRSKLQAAIFDPAKDHTNEPFQGFPCLQHVTFYKSENGGLILNSFYAIQYLYRRAYGNWLGLINLGKFVAKETGLQFERLNCFIGVEHLDHLKKFQSKKLVAEINNEAPI